MGLHRNHVLAIASTGEIGRGLGKNAGEWTGRVEISREEIPGSKRSMHGNISKHFKGRTFKLCILTRWDFNFCVRSSPLRGQATTELEMKYQYIGKDKLNSDATSTRTPSKTPNKNNTGSYQTFDPFHPV